MPEGDTIWRTADRLKPALEGKEILEFRAPRVVGMMPQPGWVIDEVEARGKYLLVHLSAPASAEQDGVERDGKDSLTLETHMMMTGSWHIYRSGERWRKSARSMRASIETTSGWQAVCFGAPHVVVRRRDRSPSAGIDHLGPDLCSPDPDLDAAVAAFDLHAEPQTAIGVALLDQRICCGVGNVYKSEVLHACQLAPTTPVRALSAARRRELIVTAHRLLRGNLGSGARTTTTATGEGLAVYGRAGQTCPRCRHLILRIVQGEHTRSTYWCEGCQLVPGVTRPDS